MSNKITPYFIALSLNLITSVSSAQDISQLCESFFTDVRSGKITPIPAEILLPVNANSVFDILKPYLDDSISSIRAKAYEITHRAASAATSPPIRIKGVLALTQSLSDADILNVRSGLQYLTAFSKEDFSKSAKDSVIKNNKIKNSEFDQWIKLAGFLHLTEVKDEIRPYVQAGNPRQIRWATLLALARMGDAPALNDLMQRVSKLPVNDDLIYKVFPDLIYTRQRESLDYMIQALNSDEKNCMSADAEKETEILCGYRIMEQLAPVIKDYPFKLDESGDIDTEDYPAALLTVRSWFRTHKKYIILNDRF